MTLERSDNAHDWTRPSGNFRKGAPLGSLQIVPVLVGGAALVAIGVALGAWLAGSEEDWSDNQIFKDRARQLHSKLLTIQCAVVGSNVDILNLNGSVVCKAGTRSTCKPDAILTGRWRSYLGSFGTFFREAESRTLGPSSADGALLKRYTEQAIRFVEEFSGICPDVNKKMNPDAPPEEDGSFLSGVPWSLIIGGGLGVVAVLALLRTPAAPIIINTSEALERGARRAGSAIRRRF